ncbi:MAG: hypothetical protein HZB33_09995 [Nitrospirae bacterium]|nr:hypothetical protein [Nitrospirota bacterium]
MKSRVFISVVLLFILAGCGTFRVRDNPPVADETEVLAEKIVGVYGGKQAVEWMTGVHASGLTEAYMRKDQGTYELHFRRPGRLRVETKYQKSSETRILNGDRGYRGTERVPLTEVKDHRLLAMIYQYKHFDLLYGLLKGAYSVELLAPEEINGKQVNVLRLSDKEGPPMDVYIDAITFHIVRITGHFTVSEGVKTTLSSEFSDFRKVGGLVFPFKITYYGGPQKIAGTVINKYEINPEMAESLFNP